MLITKKNGVYIHLTSFFPVGTIKLLYCRIGDHQCSCSL